MSYALKKSPASIDGPGDYRTAWSVAVLSPYKLQVEQMRTHFQRTFLASELTDVQVQTIDGFQVRSTAFSVYS